MGKRDINQLRIDSIIRVKEKQFWLKTISGEIFKSQFPNNNIRNNMPDERKMIPDNFKSLNYKVDENITKRILSLCNDSDNKILILLVTVLNILLRKYNSSNDILIGLPVLKQHNKEDLLNKIVVLRNIINDDASAKELLMQVKDTLVGAFKHNNYPIEILIEQLGFEINDDFCPLYDVAILLENFQDKSYLNEIKNSITFCFKRTQNELFLNLNYWFGLYEDTIITNIVKHFNNTLKEVLDDINKPIKNFKILSTEDRHHLLIDFNNNKNLVDYKSVVSCILEQSMKNPANVAVVQNETKIPYLDLHKKSNWVANYLLRLGIKKGCLVGVVCQDSYEAIINIIGILKTGAGYLPIDPNYPNERIDYIIKDSGIEYLLATSKFDFPIASNCNIINSQLIENSSYEEISIDILPNDIAYVIYTSGSTGKPKGVLISHSNLSAYICAFNNEFKLDYEDVVLHQASLSFDISIEEIFPILTKGGSILVASKEEVLDSDRLSNLLFDNKVSLISVSPLLLNEINKISPEKLVHIHTYISGGDVLKKEYYDQIIKIGHVYNTYGPTESTVCITYKKCNQDDNSLVSIGKPIQNYKVYILDSNNELLPIGVSGEICVSGPGVSRGYLNNMYLTHKKFIKNPFFPGEYIYKTGDLGHWSEDGEIYFDGRIDHQVKIRGYRVELGEIENQLMALESICESVVLDKEDASGVKFLCAYYVREKKAGNNELNIKKYLSNKLPDYMIPANYIELEEIPLTINGKIDRKALLSIELVAENNYVAPQTDLEKKLVLLWSNVLDIKPDIIGIKNDFFELGGHSLKAMILLGRIRKELEVEVSLANFFKFSIIKDLSEHIKTLKCFKLINIDPQPKQKYYPLSSTQRRMYFLYEFEQESIAYNILQINNIKESVKVEHVEQVFNKLILRHESLRTSIKIVEGIPMQKVHDYVDFSIDYYEETDSERVDEIIKSFVKPFDLGKPCYLRVGLIKINENNYTLILDIHHIIYDELSHHILSRDFKRLLSGEELSDLRIQYKDFAVWQNTNEVKKQLEGQREYWMEEFLGELPILDLPYDYNRPVVQSFEGAHIDFTISKHQTEILYKISKEEGSTIFMVLLTCFNVFLSKLSGQEDIIIGSPVSGRSHPDLEEIVGMFVNTIALRNYPEGEKTFREFLNEVKDKTLVAFSNQDYPFEDIVEQIDIDRDISRNPIFDILFVLLDQRDDQNVDSQEALSISHHSLELSSDHTSKFDLTLFAQETLDKIHFIFEYSTKLFSKKTLNRFKNYFLTLIEEITANPDLKIKYLSLLTEKGKVDLIDFNNNTNNKFSREKTIIDFFEEQVERNSNQNALIFGRDKLTYRELNERSNQLANYLKKNGAEKENIIGLMINRSFEMIIGILGILKAGAAYLPIDINYPKERVKYMLSNSETKMILVDNSYEDVEGMECININKLDYTNENKEIDERFTYPESLAYIIYTSGSTGRPKGVMLQHLPLSNLIFWHNNTLNKSKSTLQFAPISFDMSFYEIFVTLCAGATLHLISEEIRGDLNKLMHYISDSKIEKLMLPVIMLQQLAKEYEDEPQFFRSLKEVVTAGEQLVITDPIKNIFRRLKKTRLHNHYGPSETHVVTAYELGETPDNWFPYIPIGKPIFNTQIYILDKYKQFVPYGVKGELYISGTNLAKGYLNNDELTKAKFIENPYNEGTLMYKTGDVARWLPDGNIEFLGRIDHQVKVRGYRIELGEVEEALRKHDKVKECVVISKEDGFENYLCAYVTLNGKKSSSLSEVKGNKQLKIDEGELGIREFLMKYLPEYMIPSYLVVLDELPLTPSGKINKKELPQPDLGVGNDYLPPVNKVEEQLLEIWAEVLNIEQDKISTNRSFFELGGHSLKASVCINQIKKSFNRNIPLVNFFKKPTISQLAEYLNENVSERVAENEILVLLRKGKLDGENIFLIHDGSGEVDGYIEFCKLANDDINYWGIKAANIKNIGPINIEIEEIALMYVDVILKINTTNTYNIIGWSLGGSIAYEIARILEQRGEIINFLGIVDSMPPQTEDINNIVEEFTIDTEIDWISNYVSKEEINSRINLKSDLNKFWIDLINYLKGSDITKDEIKKEISNHIGFELIDFDKMQIEELLQYMNFVRSLRRSYNNYMPKNKINSQIFYFAAKDSIGVINDDWSKFTEKGVVYKEIKGNHFSIFKLPFVKELFEQYKECCKINKMKKILI